MYFAAGWGPTGLGCEVCMFVAGWSHALRSEWPFMSITIADQFIAIAIARYRILTVIMTIIPMKAAATAI